MVKTARNAVSFSGAAILWNAAREEFIILMPNTTLEGVIAFAEKLIARVEELQIPHSGSAAGHVTISCGVASTVPNRMNSAETLLLAADKALYQAKHNGKNQVSIGRFDV